MKHGDRPYGLRLSPCFLLSVAMCGIVVAIWIMASMTVFSESYLTSLYPRYCSLAPAFPNRKMMLSGSGLADMYSLIRIRDSRALDAAPAVPDIVLVFVHGHHGGAGQADTIAYATASAFTTTKKWAELYALDFNSGSSAFDAAVAHVQVDFLRESLDYVATLHPGAEVIVISHSMGGVVSRAALAKPFARNNQLTTLITVNSPLKMHPLLTDPNFASLYDVAEESLDMAVISILGGHRDTLVPSTFGILKPHANLLSLFTASIKGVWTDLGHDDAMACTELWDPIIASVIAAANMQTPADRIRVYKQRLQAASLTSADSGTESEAHESVVQRTADGVYSVFTPTALLSNEPCSKILTSSSVDLMDIPSPYVADHDEGKQKDFIAQRGNAPCWRCMVTVNKDFPVNLSSPDLLTFGNIRHLEVGIGSLSSSTLYLPHSTSSATIDFTVRKPWSSALWNGFLPAVFFMTISRRDLPSTFAMTPAVQEVMVIQSDHPASGELRWYRNTHSSNIWTTTVAFHPGNAKSLRSRLALSPDYSYDINIGIDWIASLGAGLRLADKSALIFPFVSIIFYHIASLPHPAFSAAFIMPLISWLSSQFAYDDGWSAPKFGIILNVALFWIALSVFTLVAILARLSQIFVRPRARTVGRTKLFSQYPRLSSFIILLFTLFLGPWPFVAAVWIQAAVRTIRVRTTRFKALVLGAYLTVIALKATLVVSVGQRLATSRNLSWTSKLFDTGPGIGGLFGNEIILSAPICVHLILMYCKPLMHGKTDATLWLRMAATFTCFVTVSSHYRLFEFIFATSLFAFCCILEHVSMVIKRPKGSVV